MNFSKILLGLSLGVAFVSAPAFADQAPAPAGAQAIYEGLDAPAAVSSLPPSLQSADQVNAKSIGGLTCYESSKAQVISYNCSVVMDAGLGKSDMKAIYNAISDKLETEEAPINGKKVHRKVLGGLDCTKTAVNFIDNDFTCTLTL